MPCNAPLVAWYAKDKTPRGLRGVTFDAREALIDRPINIPCAQCYGCKLDKANQWAIRCIHEAQMHDDNCFVTLTYNEENLPREKNGTPTLRPKDFTNFMKKLRKRRDGKISYFQCGEYGELRRPHHHALLFNVGFGDRTLWRKSGDYDLYRSEELEELWKFGHSEIGTATLESAGYIARYTLEKDKEKEGRKKQYLTMSRRPGIGATWLKKYISDVYPTDQVINNNGKELRPPRYYDQQLEKENEKLYKKIKIQRIKKLTEEQKSGRRNLARETILRAKSKLRSRTL